MRFNWVPSPRLALGLAAGLFTALSLYSGARRQSVWIVVHSVAPGMPILASDLKQVAVVKGVAPPPDAVARVPLVAGQTLVAGDVTTHAKAGRYSVTFTVNASQAQGLQAGDYVQIADPGPKGFWISPVVELQQVNMQNLSGAPPSIQVMASPTVIESLVQHESPNWAIINRGFTR